MVTLLLGVTPLVPAPSALGAAMPVDPLAPQVGAQSEPAESLRTVALFQGFNGFTYSGPDGADAGSIGGGLADPDALVAIFAYDPDNDRFNVWRNGPAFLNTLTRLVSNQAPFLLLDRPSTWVGPALPYPAQTLPVSQGFNLIPYLGADGLGPAEAWRNFPTLLLSPPSSTWIPPARRTDHSGAKRPRS